MEQLTINNVQLIRDNVLFFSNDNKSRYYYKFVALVRAKDYQEHNQPLSNKQGSREIVVHQWLVSSYEQFDKLIGDMLTFVRLFRCRLYVTTDRKDIVKTFVYAKNRLSEVVDNLALGQKDVSGRLLNKLVNSASSVDETSEHNGRRWMFDVDSKDRQILQQVIDSCDRHYICSIPTKSGYHVLAYRQLNAKAVKLPDCVELKDNALTLVAMY